MRDSKRRSFEPPPLPAPARLRHHITRSNIHDESDTGARRLPLHHLEMHALLRGRTAAWDIKASTARGGRVQLSRAGEPSWGTS